MQQMPPPIAGDIAELETLFARLKEDAGEEGFFERLDDRHTAQFIDGNDTLLVCFEHVAAVMTARREMQTLARRVQTRTGCAQLSLLTSGDTWFRSDAVYAFFDDLLDDGFFDDFNRFVFFGAGQEGYAAAAFSVVASGSEILLIQPQATLTPRAAGWDRRFLHTRQMDFTQRYGYAPNMIETADTVVVVFDPAFDEDAMHAQLFERNWVELLRARHLGPEGGAVLDQLGLLDRLLDKAVKDGLTATSVALRLRARRKTPGYLHAVMDHAEASGREARVARVRGFASRFAADARFTRDANAPRNGTAPETTTTAPSSDTRALTVGDTLAQSQAVPLSAADTSPGLSNAPQGDRVSRDEPAPQPLCENAKPEAHPKPELGTNTNPSNAFEDISAATGHVSEALSASQPSAAAPAAAAAPRMIPQPNQPMGSFTLAQGRGVVVDPAPHDGDATKPQDNANAAETPMANGASAKMPDAQNATGTADLAISDSEIALSKPKVQCAAVETRPAGSATPADEGSGTAPTAVPPNSKTNATVNAKPNTLGHLRADIQRRRGHAPLRGKSRRPGKRRL